MPTSQPSKVDQLAILINVKRYGTASWHQVAKEAGFTESYCQDLFKPFQGKKLDEEIKALRNEAHKEIKAVLGELEREYKRIKKEEEQDKPPLIPDISTTPLAPRKEGSPLKPFPSDVEMLTDLESIHGGFSSY
jgi:phosphoglycolate phosphatase-like HAD superfamily hydrolase